MKFGNTGSNQTKKLELKSTMKNPATNLNTNLSKDPKKKQTFEGFKKSFAKVDINKPKNTITNTTNFNAITTFAKINCKSTPEIINNDMIKLNYDNKKIEKNEDGFNSLKDNDHKRNLNLNDGNQKDAKDTTQENFTSPNLRPNLKNTNQNAKNIQLNLWKKPIVVANIQNPNGNIINSNINGLNSENINSASKFSKMKINPNNNNINSNLNVINQMNSKEINLKKGLNFGISGNLVTNFNNSDYSCNNKFSQTNTQILSTNNTEKKEENNENKINREIVVIPINKYLEVSKKLDNVELHDKNKNLLNKFDLEERIQDIKNNKINNLNNHTPKIGYNLDGEMKNQDIESKIISNNNKQNFPSLSNNYITNFNTQISIGITKENIQSEILSSILNFKTLLKTNEGNGDIEKLFNCEENLNIINQLNNKLNLFGGIAASKNFNYLPKEKSLLNENNIIKRNTFIENSVNNKIKTSCFSLLHNDNIVKTQKLNEQVLNKNNEEIEIEKYQNINLISATMLSNQYSPKMSKNQNFSSNKKQNTNFNKYNKEIILDEIQTNAEMRMRKYEILIDFINSNLKEINQMVTTNFNKISQHRRQPTQDILTNRDEFNSNKFSSLHSRINLNSRTNLSNLLNEKENVCDYEETEMLEKSNLILPINRIKYDGSVVLNLDTLKKEESPGENKNLHEVCPSFFISSINSDYYQNFLEESNCVNIIPHVNNLNNLSIELSTIKAQNETVRRLERMVSIDSDKTPLQYMNLFNSIVKSNDRLPKIFENSIYMNNINHRPINYKSSVALNEQIRDKDQTLIQNNNIRAKDESIHTAYLDYNEGEENLEDSELDKTKENNKIFNFQHPSNDMTNRENERIKFLAHKIPPKILKSNIVKVIKEKPPKIPEEKSSKCTIF